MNIAVVTPYIGEPVEDVRRCIESVEAQTLPAAAHVFVCDGTSFPLAPEALPAQVQVITLPAGTNDTGATPRAIGTIYAQALFCTGVAYLDVDNTWHPDHLALAAQARDAGADVVLSRRWICHYLTREPLFEDDDDHLHQVVDTNCISLFGDAIHAGSQWWRMPKVPGERVAGADRYLWRSLEAFARQRRLQVVRTERATVYYRSRWLEHYEKIDATPPSPAKKLVLEDGHWFARWV